MTPSKHKNDDRPRTMKMSLEKDANLSSRADAEFQTLQATSWQGSHATRNAHLDRRRG